jgi:hypothetical protein
VGQSLQFISQYEIDVQLLRELRAIQEQTARESGQLHDKCEQGREDQPDIIERLKKAHQRMAALKLQRQADSERKAAAQAKEQDPCNLDLSAMLST